MKQPSWNYSMPLSEKSSSVPQLTFSNSGPIWDALWSSAETGRACTRVAVDYWEDLAQWHSRSERCGDAEHRSDGRGLARWMDGNTGRVCRTCLLQMGVAVVEEEGRNAAPKCAMTAVSPW
jgi:hypothetical protein